MANCQGEGEEQGRSVGEGVEGDVHEACFEVEMWACGASGVAAEGYGGACCDVLAGGDERAMEMGITGVKAAVMADDNEVAIAVGLEAYALHGAAESCADGVAYSHAYVHAVMDAMEGFAPSVATCDGAKGGDVGSLEFGVRAFA